MARSFSSNSNTSTQKHEVFISFRGEDTRKTLKSHLNAALKRLDIKTYIDNNLERGDQISASLVRAIEDAELSVIVFSKNYANSKWCLDELLKILECRRTRGQIIVPVFYGMDPSDVRHQRGSYAEALAKLEENVEDKKKVREWKISLEEAANYSGWDCNVNRTEYEIVEEIAMDVLQKLNRAYVGDLDHLITKFEKLAELQNQYSQDTGTLESWNNYQATLQRVTELKMERNVRLLRFTADMLSQIKY